MSSFVQVDYPAEHPGLVRLGNAYTFFNRAWRGAAHGSLALTAMVAAALVLANHVVDTWTDGHLLAAWILMWLIAFGALALFAAPTKRARRAASSAVARWRAEQAQAQEDRQTLELAMTDARVMADISRAMDAQARVGH
ncbi:hypothetical protein JI739_13285 [Ramlibacter sp. AW1]|uniref:Uncharacterized protein n=1 Tax=Ramlibacter aurantiacus TaxID=2801330 RepID=A0A937D5H3_9BURK|nr:hypothetical protein [Ramlibacter aurantiacus]MBL0421327.1 hypothetical protein [Ramlibacter aurantiacus]